MNKKRTFLTIATMAALSASTLSFSMNIEDAIKTHNVVRAREILEDKTNKDFDINQNSYKIPTISGENTLLHLACSIKDIEIVDLLLKHMADPNKTNTTGWWTVLNEACYRGATEIVKLLLINGVIIDETSISMTKDTPLYRTFFELVRNYDNAENKIQFINLQTKDDDNWLIKRHLNSRKKQTLFSNLSKDNKYKKLNDTRIFTIK